MKTFTTFIHTFTLTASLCLATASLAAEETTTDKVPAEPSAATQPPADSVQPAGEAKQEGDTKEGDIKEGEQKEGEAKTATDAQPATTETPAVLASTTSNLTHKLRSQIEEIDKQFALIKDPSSLIISTIKSRKSYIERSLTRIDKLALELSELQEEFNQTSTGSYNFECETDEVRFKYTNDGSAALNSLLNDLKERNYNRKALGLNKFEAFRKNFMGIDGYLEAYKIYAYNIIGLQKKWEKMLSTEVKKRSRYNDKKLEAALVAEEEDTEKMEHALEAAGYDITKDWFNPDSKNTILLKRMIVRSTRAMRDIESSAKESDKEGTGAVSPLIVDFWAKMDETREMMITGNLSGAKETLSSDPCFDKVLKLNRDLLPEDYCAPMRNDYRDLRNEIDNRLRNQSKLEYRLESKNNYLEREVDSAQSQIQAVLEEIEKELALQNETETEQATHLSQADRLKASQEADEEASGDNESKDTPTEETK